MAYANDGAYFQKAKSIQYRHTSPWHLLKPVKEMELLVLQAGDTKAKHFLRPCDKSECQWVPGLPLPNAAFTRPEHPEKQSCRTLTLLTPGMLFLPESRWIVLALFSFPSGLYFGSVLWEDRHKGFRLK